ncbi:MAG: helix-turn-helix domain-containing protein [Acutalibacteraceae bacterium]
MSFTTGFFQNDVNFYYVGCTKSNDTFIKNTNYKYTDNVYQMLYIIKGSAKVISGNINQRINENMLIISRPHNPLRYRFQYSQGFEYIFIDVHPSVFKNIESDDDFFSAFNTKTDEHRIFDLNASECELLKSLLNGIKMAIDEHYNRNHMIARLYALFSETYSVFSSRNQHSDMNTDSISLKIMNYITDNYQKKQITYDELSEKFFVSVPTVNKILYKWTGRPLNVFINDTRLDDAKKLMKKGDISLAQAAEICGFGNYSTFYRAYKRKFGRSPKQDKPKQESWLKI